MHHHRSPVALVLLLLLGTLVRAQEEVSEEAVNYFRQNCASCHTIGGGRLAGPDLKGVHERREPGWIVRFVQDPKAVIDSGDPYARKLLEEARGVIMPTLPGLNRAMAEKLVALIRAESALEKSRFAGMSLSDRPLTELDTERGRALFTGEIDFQSGAPACASCHTTLDLGGLGGGRLGPDLTSSFARLEGRKALSAWLSAPPSPVMAPVFREHPLEGEEILGLVAYLEEAAKSGTRAPTSASLDFLLAGTGGAALLFVAFDLIWRKRYRAVRRPMIAKDRAS